MLDFPIVDTHLHVWDTRKFRYPWLDDIPLLNKPYLPEDYRRACGPVQVGQMVFVQCEVDPAQYQQETAWVTELAQAEPRIRGIVSWAPLEKGDRARGELAQLAANPLVKGIRRIIQFEPDIEFCLRPDFVRGVQALPDYGLSFDLCVAPVHLANTCKLVAQCPKVSFILDHIGKPYIRQQILDPWRQEIKTLASFPNVWCKMSGLVTEADHQNWKREDLRPYMDHVLACFGVDRVMYGGDWPVASQASEYPRWVETLEWGMADYSHAELRKVFHDTAISFYRLDDGAKP
jgi:L-fuconolactonase